MIVKKKTAKKITESVFDTALPSKFRVGTDGGAGRHIAIRRPSQPQASPYIIRLSRGEERPLMVRPFVLDVAQELIFDGEDDGAREIARTNNAEVTRDEIRAQLREADSIVSDVRVASVLPKRSASAAVSLHMPAASAVDLNDLLDFSAVEDVVEEAEPPVLSLVSIGLVQDQPLQPAPFHWQRALAGFMVLSFVLVLPLQAMQSAGSAAGKADDISAVGRAAIDDVTRGALAFADARYDVAEDQFSRATTKFTDAQKELSDMHAVIATVVSVMPQTNRTYQSVSGLITAGRELSTIASIMSVAADTIAPQAAIDVVTKLELLATAVDAALPHADVAALALTNVDANVIPSEYADRVLSLQNYAPRLTAALHEFTSFAHALATMLGGDGAMRYLVAFQNPTELRPTGGFIGSFAEVDVRHGAIADMRIPGGGSYDVQGQLTKFVASPSPLSIIDPRWEMQDANWFPDFPTSARKLQWFYENASGPSTDGVIAVNATFVVELLKILGPVDMPKYGRTIDAENFMFEAQKIVELEYDKVENAPKAFIGDLAPILLDRIAKADMQTFLEVLDLVGSSFEQKNIQLYFTNDNLQAAVQDLGWSGAMKQTGGDYLMVVNTNLGGGKTDAVIDQNIDVDVTVDEDGSVTNTLTITKVHHGIANALFSGRNNVDYLRLYVPEGSELVSVDGFEAPPESAFETSDVPLGVDEDLQLAMSAVDKDVQSGTDVWTENGKTVFGNWMQTAPGETQVVHVTYRLPRGIFENENHGLWAAAKERLGIRNVVPYTLFVQKQSGADTRVTNVSVSFPPDMPVVWSSHEGLNSSPVTVNNATDAFFRILVEKP